MFDRALFDQIVFNGTRTILRTVRALLYAKSYRNVTVFTKPYRNVAVSTKSYRDVAVFTKPYRDIVVFTKPHRNVRIIIGGEL